MRRGADGRSYAKFGPGFALATVPVLFVARRLPEALQPPIRHRSVESIRRDEFWAQATNAVLMGAVIALIFRFGVSLGYAAPTAAAVALAVAFGSPLWLYARIDGSEALQAFGFLAAAYLLTRHAHERPAAVTGGGAALGLAILGKVANLVALPAFALLCLVGPWRRSTRLLAFLAPLVLCALTLAVWNAQRFGDPFQTGYPAWSTKLSIPWLEGASLLLFSPAFGLVFFWPAFLLALYGAGAFVRRHPREALIGVAVFATLLALYGKWWATFGMSWGPRYLVPAIPLLALFLLPVFADRRFFVRALVVILVAAGLSVQLIAVSSSWWQQVFLVQRSVYARAAGERFVAPELAPLRVGAWLLRAKVVERTSGPEAAHAFLSAPPWNETFPVPDPERFADELLPMLGVDLWAAPEAWRMPYRTITRGPLTGESVPSNPLLASVVAGIAAGAAAWLGSRLRAVGREGKAALRP